MFIYSFICYSLFTLYNWAIFAYKRSVMNRSMIFFRFMLLTWSVWKINCYDYFLGGFDWRLNFFWESLPDKDRARRLRDPTVEVKTPAIAGGLFAINREWFLELGIYDEKMEVKLRLFCEISHNQLLYQRLAAWKFVNLKFISSFDKIHINFNITKI